jgi:hypothetical protein
MTIKAEDLVEQLLAKAVHHRHDDDQRRNAQRDADEGEDAGDDGNEPLASARPRIDGAATASTRRERRRGSRLTGHAVLPRHPEFHDSGPFHAMMASRMAAESTQAA